MAAVPITSSAVPLRAPNETFEEQPASKVNYLNRCVELITEKTEIEYKRWGHLHLTLGVATGVLFIAAVITGIVLTAIFAPPSIPFVALGAFCLTFSIQNFIASRLTVSSQCYKNAEMVAELRTILEKLPSTQQSMSIALHKLNISVHDIASDAVKKELVKLRPILAQYTYYHDLATKCAEEATAKRAAEKAHVKKYPKESEQITEHRMKALSLEEAVLIAKTRASFYLGLLRNPEYSREESVLMKFGSTIDGDNLALAHDYVLLGKRALATQFGDTKEDLFLTISNPGSSELLTRAQVKEMTEDQLRQRLFV